MDYQEGYADGIAGAGMQERADQVYCFGFDDGSIDRRAMLANRVIEYDAPQYKLLEDE